MNIHMTIDQPIDQQAERYRAAIAKVDRGLELFRAGQKQSKEGRQLWIEGTLELATVLKQKRIDFPDNASFGRWLERHGLRHLSHPDISALHGFGRDIQAARTMLEESQAITWRGVWEKKPKREAKSTPSIDGRSPPSHRIGSNKRKRAAVIPTVMRDDYIPGEIAKRAAENPEPKRRRRSSVPAADAAPPRERPVPKLKGLTPAQVDPDFEGDTHDFARKYGLVLLHTKQQIEHNKQQEVLMAWLGLVSDHERTARAVIAATVDPAILREWMGKPAKAAKFQAWCKNIQLAAENIRKIVEHEQPSILVDGSAI